MASGIEESDIARWFGGVEFRDFAVLEGFDRGVFSRLHLLSRLLTVSCCQPEARWSG